MLLLHLDAMMLLLMTCSCVNQASYGIFVVVKSAAGLAALSSKTSDPLVHVEINKTKSTRKSCPKIKKTVDPVWDKDNKFEFKDVKRNACRLLCVCVCMCVLVVVVALYLWSVSMLASMWCA